MTRKVLLYLTFILVLSAGKAIAQPVINYTPSTNVYTTGTAISTLTPTGVGVGTWGGYKTGVAFGSGYSNPEDLAFDPSGNLYVTNLGNNTIRKFNSAGTFVSTFGSGYNNPTNISFDAAGNSYITNYGSNSIIKITSAGVQSTLFSGLGNPFGNVVDAAGNIYVTNYGSNNVRKFNSSGLLISTISTSAPVDIDLDNNGNLYILNYSSGAISKYSPSGTLITTISTAAGGPFSVNIDAAGNIYIADSNNNRLLIYNSSGTLIGNIAASSTPRGVETDASGNLYATLYGSNVVNKYVPTGGYYINKPLPAGLSFNSSTGAISGTPTAISPATTYTITAYNATGSSNTNVTITVNPPVPNVSYTTPQTFYVGTSISGVTPTNTGGPVGGFSAISSYGSVSVNNSNGMAEDASGNLYVTSNTGNAVYIYNSSGTLTTTRTGYSSPAGIIVDPSGNSYVANNGAGNIIKTTSAGVQTTISGGGLSQPVALTMDAAGNIYVADYAGTIYKIAAGTTTPVSYITGIANPWGIAVNAAGDLYISSTNTNYIYKVLAGSTTPTTFVTAGLSSPRNMVIDGSGNIYQADAGTGTINLISPAGVVTNLATGISSPVGIALDPSGNIFTSTYNFATVYKITATGYSISPALPAGMLFNKNNGSISGTPTVSSAATNYTVTATNAGGTSSPVVNITVVYPTAPTAGNVAICGAGAVSPTASGSLPSGGTYNWYTAATGGTLLQSNTSTTYNASAVTSTTYYVSYTSGTYTTARTPVTATVNPIVSSPMSGAVFSYPFNNNYVDISGNAYYGYSTAAPTITADRYGVANSAYSFNGSSQYITANGTGTAVIGSNTFTLSIWFNTTTTSGGRLIGFGNSNNALSGTYDRHIYMANGGQLYYGIYPNSVQTINTTATYNDGNWHHVIVTTGSGGSFLYVDGVLQASNTSMTTAQAFSGFWKIGGDNLSGWTNSPSSNYFNGLLDDVAVYNRVLSPAEIAASNDLNQIGTTTTPLCVGNPISFTAPAITGATYTWTDPSGATQTGQNPTFASAVSGNYSLTVTGGPGGCSSTSTITPVLNAAPSATFTATSNVYVNTTATITLGTYVASSTYNWTFAGGTPSTGTGAGPFSVQWSTIGAKTVTLTVTNSTGCTATSTQTVNVVSPNYSNYAYSRVVTLNTTSLGITSNLSGFPALLSIQSNDLIINGTCDDKVFNPNGPNYDFAFLDPNSATELNYQIESYNQTTGTLLVWVKIPSITYATNNSISFYYGSTSPTVTHNTAFFANTWPSDYQMVYHFNESAYTGTTNDGTAGGHTGTATGLAAANLINGKIGNAYSFNGSSKFTTTAISLTGTFTLSAWVNLSSNGRDQKIMTNQTSAGGGSGGYKVGVYSDNTPETESGAAGDRSSTPTPAGFGTNAWHYVQGVYSGTTLSTYVDGVQYKISNTTTNPSGTGPVYVGVGEGGTAYYFYGTIDEPRISNVAKSSDWIKAEYGDQNNPAAFTGVSTTRIVNNSVAATLNGGLTYTWKGVDTNPLNAANWDNTTAGITNQVPAFTGTTTLVIPSSPNYPALTANEAIYGLTIASGAQFNLNGYTLSVGCNIYNSTGGQILYGSNNSSGITWNGSLASQTYNGSSTTGTASLGSMTVNNSANGTVTITGGPVDIYTSLTLLQGNLVVSGSPAALTLKSTATQSAGVAAIPSGNSITGNITVERYLTGGLLNYRGYRLLSSPVYAITDPVNSNKVFSLNYLKNSIYLTGTSTTGGMDNTASANPTLYLYRENLAPLYTNFLNSNFRGINNINSSPQYGMDDATYTNTYIPIGNGYLCFFRGNRASASFTAETTSSYVPQTVTLSTTGTLNQGQIIVRDWYTPASPNLGWTNATANSSVRGYNLVGNPYASSIDWEQYNNSTTTTGIYATSNVGNTIYVIDPVSKNYGVYTKGGGGIGTNNASNIIASGQGFFVQTNSATVPSAPQLIFNESAKTTTQPTGSKLLMGRPADYNTLSRYLQLRMEKDTLNTDEILIRFDDLASTKYVFNEDAAYKFGNGAVSLSSLSSDSVALAINIQPLPTPSVAIPLKVNATASGDYTLNMITIKQIPDLYEIWLMDAFKKDSLDMRQNKVYGFSIKKTDSSTFGSKRFTLVLRQSPALQMHLISFTGSKVTAGAQLVWKTEHEEDYTNFTIEKSTDDGKTFTVLGGFTSNTQGTYSFTDTKPGTTNNKYRLKLEDFNGVITYSDIVTLNYGKVIATVGNTDAVSVYPNPTSGPITVSILQNTLVLANPGNISYNIVITGSSGSVVKTATASSTQWEGNVGNLLPGSYVVQVINNTDKSVVGKAKFIKL